MLAEQGDYNGGWVWHANEGSLTFAVAFVSEHVTTMCGPVPLGASILRVVGRPADGGMDLIAEADGSLVAEDHLPHEWPGLWTPNSSASLLAGVGRHLPVCDGYDPLVEFSGDLRRLVVEADGGASFTELSHRMDVAFRSQ